MAIIYQALELMNAEGKGTGLYHYCARSDEENWPPYAVGGCAENNCPGHSTPQAAKLHYEEWQLENTARYQIVSKETKKKCAVCGEWTQMRAQVGREFFEEFALCELHNNEAYLRSLYLTN